MKCVLKFESIITEFDHQLVPPKRIAPIELVEQCERRNGILYAPAGTVIEHPECWRLVLMGTADPADDECCEMDARTPEQKAAAQVALQRLQLGIHPDDFKAYAAGEMVGYDKAGNPIPGPNAKPDTDDEEQE